MQNKFAVSEINVELSEMLCYRSVTVEEETTREVFCWGYCPRGGNVQPLPFPAAIGARCPRVSGDHRGTVASDEEPGSSQRGEEPR